MNGRKMIKKTLAIMGIGVAMKIMIDCAIFLNDENKSKEFDSFLEKYEMYRKEIV